MIFLELAGILAGIFVVFFYAKKTPDPRVFLARLGLVSVAAWTTEESCILLYRFYAYHPAWRLLLDQVPLLVVVIWPVIIISAMDLSSQRSVAVRRMSSLAGAAIVGSDALFIEPLSVNAGLWHWQAPGIFNVPLIGILGWFFFALLCIRLLQDKRLQGPLTHLDLWLLVFPVSGTHLLLLMAWWGALRWITVRPASLFWAVAAWTVSAVWILLILKNHYGCFIKKNTLVWRLSAALFFFVLLALTPAKTPLLTAYALAFVPPYVTLMVQQYRCGPEPKPGL